MNGPVGTSCLRLRITKEGSIKVDTISSRVHFEYAVLPLKLLAVLSGLGEYGRNNLCHVPGMGSYHRLVAFYTDIPCPEAGFTEPKMMEKCTLCRACTRRCPSHAIPDDRFLVHAERLPSETVLKLKRLDMLAYTNVLGRNLAMLLRQRRQHLDHRRHIWPLRRNE